VLGVPGQASIVPFITNTDQMVGDGELWTLYGGNFGIGPDLTHAVWMGDVIEDATEGAKPSMVGAATSEWNADSINTYNELQSDEPDMAGWIVGGCTAPSRCADAGDQIPHVSTANPWSGSKSIKAHAQGNCGTNDSDFQYKFAQSASDSGFVSEAYFTF
jgi:hypothetical protein